MLRDHLKPFRHWTKKVAEFTAGRIPQSDDAFLAACELPVHVDAARFALAVRKVFAEEGSVDRKFIYATDRYPQDLGILPFWDSIDWLDLVFRLEKELNAKIPGGGFIPGEFTVRNYVHTLIRTVQTDSKTPK